MALPGFDKNYYLNAKLQQLQSDPATAAEWADKTVAFLDRTLENSFGLTAEQHYEQYGYQEGLAPNAFFNVEEYIQAKATAMFNAPSSPYASVEAAADAFVSIWGEIGSGNVYSHYLQYGAAEGVDPSNDFDASAYLEEKLAALQAAGETQYQSVEDVQRAFTSSELNPLTHFLIYGRDEGFDAPAVQPEETPEEPDDNDETDGNSGGGNTGGGGGTPAPTLTVAVDAAHALTFAGTATDAISVSLDASNSEVVFTREGASARLGAADYNRLVSVNAGTAELSAPGSLLDKEALAITSGQLTLTGVTSSMDFSGLTGSPPTALNVTDGETGVVDITPLAGGLNVTAVDLPAGATAAMTLAQHGAIALTGGGSYALKDTADNLAPDTGSITVDSAVVTGVDVTVTDAASIAQLTALDAANGGGALDYTTVSGTASELQIDAATNGNAGTYVTNGKNVRVTDEISVSGLDTVKAAIGNGTVTAQDLKDTAANLTDSSGSTITVSDYIGEGTNVNITGDATIAQIKAIDAQNGDGTLTYALVDTFEAIVADLNDTAYDYLTGASEINLTTTTLGDVTVAEMQAVATLAAEPYEVKDGSGSVIALGGLTYDLKDTPANLASSAADDILASAVSVTATEAASVGQAKAIYEDSNAATYNIEDYVSNLVSNDGNSAAAITQGENLTAINTADAAEAKTIESRKGTEGVLKYNVSDTFANLTNSVNAAGVNAATDLTVSQSGSVNTAPAETVIALTNSGLTTIPSIQGNVSAINTFLGKAANEENATLSYGYKVTDSWANVKTALDAPNLAFIEGASADGSVTADSVASSITITGTVSAENAETFWQAVNGVFSGITANAPSVAARTSYHVDEADVTKLDDTVAARDSIKDATTITISDTAEAIYQAQISQDNDDIFALMDTRGNHRDHITVTASAGYQKIDGTPGNDKITLGDGNDTANGFDGADTIKGESGDDTINGGNGSDTLEGGTGDDTITGGAGADTIRGGNDTDTDYLYGGSGRDTIYAGDSAADTTSSNSTYINSITGDGGGDRLYGGENRDKFIYAGTDRSTLIDESGTTQNTRDYIENFTLGDTIDFSGVQNSHVQFFGSGSANASAVDPGTLGLSLRYEKDVQVQNWAGSAIENATRILVDIADANGQFDDQADMHIILVGTNIDVNWSGHDIVFGG